LEIIVEELKQKLEELKKMAKVQGISFIGCLATYPPNSHADFSSAVSLSNHADCNHAMLDMMRELMVNWSNAEHTSQLVWQEKN
jgi:hypothetical protein